MSERRVYNLSPLQEDVRRIARDFGEREIQPLAEKQDRGSPRFPAGLYGKMARAGFLGYTEQSLYGGGGKSWIEYATLIEELSFFDASAGFTLSIGNLAIGALTMFGTDEQKHRFVPGMIQGERIGAFALTEPGAGSDVSNLSTTIQKQGDMCLVDGQKRFISSGDAAHIIILVGKYSEDEQDRGPAVLAVETEGLQGLTRRVLKHKMGLRGSTTADLTFRGCRVPAENLLGGPGQGFRVAMKSLDCSRVAIAAQAVGLGQACLQRAVDYAKQREAFGGPIANLQAVQFMIADMSTRLEASRMLTCKAALLMDEGKDFTLESAQAKLYASEMANFTADRAVQILGGSGYTGDFSDVEKLYRDARVIPIYEGTSEIQRMIVARKLLK
ncbi:MAG TPA: acyl-CoA dehydrogenase [bacterium]|nr:acyl-CoA dehydrogenase [bacterium]